ncbi:cytochrome c maturation protein CcmE [Limisalsivibrio acetivorans]|uniref:cytochrome c maturation protein CcmE n=1 Tax=Limisalsivibrio acetivorans TaxID=1304888 RepID=UPI0003B6A9C2|nr:cytochrome c maturation protein CcmE [Limisalsivibrio acetivorans]
MNKNSKIFAAAAVIIVAVGFLLFSGFSSDTVYYLEVKEVLENPAELNKKGMRVSGAVIPGTVNKDVKNQHLVFDVEDVEGGASMKVDYKGIIPDTFKEDIHVILEGNYDIENDVFVAKTLLTKCPSKYEVDAEDAS